MIDADDVLPIIQLMSTLCPNCRERTIAASPIQDVQSWRGSCGCSSRPSLSPSSVNHTSSTPVPCVTYNVKVDSGAEGWLAQNISVVGRSESAKMIIPYGFLFCAQGNNGFNIKPDLCCIV